MQQGRWSPTEMADLCLYRLIQLCLRPVPRRGSNPLMMRRRRKTYGRRKRSVLQRKQSPVRGQTHAINKLELLDFVCSIKQDTVGWFFFLSQLHFFVKYLILEKNVKGLVDHGHPIAKQPAIYMISQQLVAPRALTEQQTLILKRRKIPKLTWILS